MGLGLMTSERRLCANEIHFSDWYHLNIHNTTTLLIRAVHAIGGLIAPWQNLQWRRFFKTGICVQWKSGKVHAFLPSVHADALTVPARMEIIHFKKLNSTIFACKWIALRSNWWSWSVSPKITFKEEIDAKWTTLLLELLDYTCPLQQRRSQTDGHQGGGTSQELCLPWRRWVIFSDLFDLC